MSENSGLSLEQRLELEQFRRKVGELSREQAQSLLKQLYQTKLIRDAEYQRLIQQKWLGP